MPFGGYADFNACVADQIKKGHSKESAKKICGSIKAKVEGKKELDIAKGLGTYLVQKGSSLSHDELRHRLQMLMETKHGSVVAGNNYLWINDVFDGYFIFEKQEKYYKQDYTVDGDEVKLGMKGPTEVKRIIEYKEV